MNHELWFTVVDVNRGHSDQMELLLLAAPIRNVQSHYSLHCLIDLLANTANNSFIKSASRQSVNFPSIADWNPLRFFSINSQKKSSMVPAAIMKSQKILS
jgi:hypothetical protein